MNAKYLQDLRQLKFIEIWDNRGWKPNTTIDGEDKE